MKKSTSLIILFITAFALTINAQKTVDQKEAVLPLKIGDKLPDLFLSKILNSSKNSSGLKDIVKGRSLIIDFFATWCGPCISSLPKYDTLSNEFKGKLQIIAVSYESKDIVVPFLEKHPEISKNLPFVVEDTILRKLFPHRIIPHAVWINDKGIVMAITDHLHVNRKNISDLINEKPLNVITKTDDLSFDRKNSLIEGKTGENATELFRSVLTGRRTGVAAGSSADYSKGIFKRVMAYNVTAVHLFNIAYAKFQFGIINNKRIFYEVKNKVELDYPKENLGMYDWLNKNTYCYEMNVAKGMPDSIFFSNMMNDLNRYFNIKAEVRQKEIPCYILYRINNNDELLRSKSLETAGAQSGKVRNYPLSNLIKFLNRYLHTEPFIDETGYNGPVDMDLDYMKISKVDAYPNIELMNKTFLRYGLQVKLENRTVPVLFIMDKGI